jgi:glycosyltransferase involved in cell wall biosynthesis
MRRYPIRILLFNLATDADDPILAFATGWIRELAERTEWIDVLTMRKGRFDMPSNVRVYSLGKEHGHSEPRRALAFYRILNHLLSSTQYDICFAHMIPVFAVMAWPLLRARRIPLVTWYAHRDRGQLLRGAERVSTCMVTSLPSAYPSGGKRAIAIGQGIDTELFAPGPDGPQEPATVLCAGRLSEIKNHHTLLQATAILMARLGPVFRVEIVGGEPGDNRAYRRTLAQQLAALDLEQVVTLTGVVHFESLPDWYRRCRVHVNLTPTGFGDKVVLESMACARPCIVANEGFRETLGIYAERLYFRYGDARDLADKIQDVLTLPDNQWELMGRYLRDQVLRLHSLDDLVERLLRVFDEASSEKARR